MSRKIFFDGGSNKGQSLCAFLDKWPAAEEFEIYCYEPDFTAFQIVRAIANSEYPQCKEKIRISQKAVWIRDGEIDFFTKSPASEGNTLLQEKVDKENRKYTKSTVDCIDLSRWIKENVSSDDFLVMKIDIEGAEYEVVQHLVSTGAIEHIDVFFLEIHGLKCNKSYSESLELIEQIKNANLVPYAWGAETFNYETYTEKIYDENKLKKEYRKWEGRGLSVT